MGGAAQIQEAAQVFTSGTRGRARCCVRHAVVSHVVRRDVDPSGTDDQCRPVDSVMNSAAGAVVVGVTGETPRVGRIITHVGMGGAAQIQEAAQIFATQSSGSACRHVHHAVVNNIVRRDVDPCWTDDQCRPADVVAHRTARAIVVTVAGKTPWIAGISARTRMRGAAQIQQAREVLAVYPRNRARRRMGRPVISDVIRRNINPSRTNDQRCLGNR